MIYIYIYVLYIYYSIYVLYDICYSAFLVRRAIIADVMWCRGAAGGAGQVRPRARRVQRRGAAAAGRRGHGTTPAAQRGAAAATARHGTLYRYSILYSIYYVVYM